MKNEKYVEALWDCYQKGIDEIPCPTIKEQKELFMHLIDDAINQVIQNCKGDGK